MVGVIYRRRTPGFAAGCAARRSSPPSRPLIAEGERERGVESPAKERHRANGDVTPQGPPTTPSTSALPLSEKYIRLPTLMNP